MEKLRRKRMRKRGVGLLGALLLTVFLIVVAYSQEEMAFVDNSVFPNPERAASIFKHEEHNEAADINACNECHHVYEDGLKIEDESSEDMLCSECHALEPTEGQPGLMKAFHLNCKGCHMSENKGPIMCGECHRNQSLE
jgi:class III cytochrome C family protein